MRMKSKSPFLVKTYNRVLLEVMKRLPAERLLILTDREVK